MERIIEAHGKKFVVEGIGFVKHHAADDFQKAVDAIEMNLMGTAEEDVVAMHAAHQQWLAADCKGDRWPCFDTIETVGHEAATANWHRPDAVHISVGTLA